MTPPRFHRNPVLLSALASLLALAVALSRPHPLAGQGAATLPPLDGAYHDVARLEAFGLVPRGATGLAPWSGARVGWLAREARGWLALRTDLPATTRRDLEAVLDRLEARFGEGREGRPRGHLEGEAFGGESPGVLFPEDWLGGLDAVLDPLWSGRGGRAYPDRAGAAAAGRLDLPLGATVAVSAGGRVVEGRWSEGPRPGRRGASVEALSARWAPGRLSVQVGRDHLWTRVGGRDGALLSTHGPPLDLVRVGTDRPLALHLLGDVDLALFVADLGPRQNFPHARLFGLQLAARPGAGLDVGFTLLNKQGGEGAPEASLAARLADLAVVPDWFRQDEGEFSDKSVALAVAHRKDRLSLFLEVSSTDVDPRRPRHTLAHGGAYRVAVALPRLGAAGRHAVEVDASYAGPLTYRHHQFTTGAAVDGYLQGALPGPAARSLSASWSWSAPAAGWRSRLALTAEERDGDVWREDEADRDRLIRVREVPDESRLRLEASVVRVLAGGAGGVETRVGVERARNLGHAEGRDRWNRAGLVRVWWGF